MDDNQKIVFNFYGGSQQINPNATTATQIYYGDQFAADKLRKETLAPLNLSPEQEALAAHVSHLENLPVYFSSLQRCETAAELADVAMLMLRQEPCITEELVVKERFIQKLLDLCPMLTTGNSIANLRVSINNALAKRPRK